MLKFPKIVRFCRKIALFVDNSQKSSENLLLVIDNLLLERKPRIARFTRFFSNLRKILKLFAGFCVYNSGTIIVSCPEQAVHNSKGNCYDYAT